ncbi:uncharacterized protein LOC117196047 [Orcinus orca]|uniref:uncharacterized protein LOC117196047 n=1 Tax=Orcinus orca TaxID=9733 RepID=UPI00211207B3|nr:uncharacterized protein LOC117196047 [Orcinus orca]
MAEGISKRGTRDLVLNWRVLLIRKHSSLSQAIRHSLLAALPLHTEKRRTRTASARAGPRGPSGNKGSRAGGRVPASGARIGAARARSEGDCFPSLRRRARVCEEKTSVLRATRINFSLRLGPLASRSLSSVSGNPRAAGAGLLGWRGPAEPVRLTRLRSRGKAEARPAWLRFPSPGAAASRPARRPSRAAAFPALSARTSRRGPHVWARPARLRAAPPPAPVPAPAARGRAEALGEGMRGADRLPSWDLRSIRA